jgi:hypothetical protein
MLKSMNSNSSQHLLLYQHPKKKKKILKKIEGVSGIDSEHGDPIFSPHHSSSGSQSSVGNFDDF